jgi:hypothetical protein
MMVVTRHTRTTDIAVFTACWFEKIARPTTMSRVEDSTVIGIPFHLLFVILRRDERLGRHTLVNENVWQDNHPWDQEPVGA